MIIKENDSILASPLEVKVNKLQHQLNILKKEIEVEAVREKNKKFRLNHYYKSNKLGNNLLFKYTEKGEPYYGFGISGEWYDKLVPGGDAKNINYIDREEYMEVTSREWHDALIKEAIKRGFTEEGAEYKSKQDSVINTISHSFNPFLTNLGGMKYSDVIHISNDIGFVYYRGVWAKLIRNTPELPVILAYKGEDINNLIKYGCKALTKEFILSLEDTDISSIVFKDRSEPYIVNRPEINKIIKYIKYYK